MKVLIFGASGMLGHVMYERLSASKNLEVYGTLRSATLKSRFPSDLQSRLIDGVFIDDMDGIANLISSKRPDVVINCVGLVKQLAESNDPLLILPTNSLFPHHLSRLCKQFEARLVQISTDCVFSGERGNYCEEDVPDAVDLYGRSKWIGEVVADHAVTIRTSIIGRELSSPHSLVEWFLGQSGNVKGYTKAMFSGLPTVELSTVIRDVILTKPELYGLFHIASSPISKHDLLHLVSVVAGKTCRITEDESLVINRTLNPEKFQRYTGYSSPDWRVLVERMLNYNAFTYV